MSSKLVRMTEEVWLTCLTHALTTETEEIMGLLFGDTQKIENGDVITLIWGASPQVRSDRRKDRVEAKPEQLTAAAAQAENMTETIGRTTRVIGWYHSHPHITVLPSHVDVNTQSMYQQLDSGFIGLIFSCFNKDAQKVGRIQVIAFQSIKQGNALIANSSLVEVESSWSSSENTRSAAGSTFINALEDTCDSRMPGTKKVGGRSSDLEEFFSHDDVNYLGKQRKRDNALVPFNDASKLNNNVVDVDSMDMSPSMQEALHRSNMDLSAAEYVRKEVPLQILPSKDLLKLNSPMASYVDMQHVLFEEEQSAYNQAISQSMSNGKIHPLTYIHHTSTYQASLCKLMEYCLSPAINALQDRLKENEIRLAQLVEESKNLELKDRSRASRRSPSQGQRGPRSPVGSSSPRSPNGVGQRRPSA